MDEYPILRYLIFNKNIYIEIKKSNNGAWGVGKSSNPIFLA